MVALYFQNKKRRIGLFVFCLIVTAAGIIFRILPGKNNLLELETKNVFAYGMSQKMYIPYTEKYLKTVKPFELNYLQERGKALNRNIILLVVESLSSFQSKYFSGLDIDNMPNFDREMSKASAVSLKYLASSYNTTANTFALLTGFSPLHTPGTHFDYSNKKYYQQTLPQIYRKHGYETVFLSPAKMVDFIDVVVKNSQFDKIIGDDDPFYANAERQVFNSVSDELLLDRLVEYVKTASEDKKYFVYAQTIAMHAPYFDHRTKEYSYVETVKTFDMYFPKFMKQLESAGFFKNNGVLVVTGDHRAMVTIETDEQKKMGFFTTQYVPLAIFGDIPEKLDTTRHYNHVDLNYSLQWLMLENPVHHQFQRNIFSDMDEENNFYCSFFQQRINPSLVIFQTRDKKGKIYLDGDNTNITGADISDEEKELINSYLVWNRTL
jgi:hypothetical protein